ncbi:MAG TPA: pseudouridine-5'-phosphate glycosidase [Alphaproteobacteria bacterium]|nr:pseudouridine-5'-phosphate glycosidase [Alphaproteobacteria bacterium]
MPLADHLTIAPEVTFGASPVALETTAIAHGLPYPRNLDVAARIEAAVRVAGATPAWCGVLDGRLRVGLSWEEIEQFAKGGDLPKVSRRDFAPLVACGGSGATTVAGTMILAQAAGVAVFATGGLGGVHREVAESLDISADLAELARTPVAVVCSGAKSILDLPKTGEALETLGVPVVGYGTDHFPAFQVLSSGLPVDCRADTAEEAAAVIRAQRSLGLGGVVIGVPVPAEEALPAAEVEAWVDQATADARSEGVRGKQITPYLLKRLAELSQGKTLSTNIALLENNAAVAAEIAVALDRSD